MHDGNLVVQERDNYNLPTVTYTRGNDLSGSFEGVGGIGGLLARTDHSAVNLQHAYYHADGNGNVTALVGVNQAVVGKYAYNPFGGILSMSGSLADANLYRFSSKEVHPMSASIYYLYRYYDPSMQRWLNRDPIAEAGGINLYRLVGNNPITALDSDGRFVVPGIVAGVIGYVGYKSICAAAEGMVAKNKSTVDGSLRTSYAHCLASCRIKNQCGKGTALAAGFIKEVMDLMHCLASFGHAKDHCYSAFQPRDFDDNKTGRDCPNDDCESQCAHLKDAPEPPPGPVYNPNPPELPPGWPYSI